MKPSWPVKKLEEVAIINPPKSEVSNIAAGTAVSFVSMASIGSQSGTITNIENRNIEDVKKGYTYFANNDILFAKITPCMENGKVAIAQNLQNSVGFGTTEVHVLRPTPQILPEWIYSVVSSEQFRANAKKHMTGTAGQQRVPREYLENAEIPVPPIEEQKKIVERLDAIRKAQELCDAQISKTEELFESILKKGLTKKEGWSELKIEELCLVTSSKRVYQSEYMDHGVPFFRTKEITELANGKKVKTELFISEERFKELKDRFGSPKKDDILISAIGTIGEIFIVDTDPHFYFKDGNVLWLKDFHGIIPDFLKLSLQFIARRLNEASAGSAYKALSIEKLKRIKIPLPSLEKQQKIVEKLSSVQEYKKLLFKQKELYKELFESALERFMKGELK